MWIEGDSFRCIFSFFCVEARESLVDRRRREAQNQSYKRRSRLARALWIEGSSTFNVVPFPGSRLARALWIEGWSSVVTVIFNRVEARESLVDRRLHRVQRFVWLYRRGSREPCGSKAVFWATACQIGAVEARESLVDRRLIWMQFPLAGTSRGSREPCGSKLL